jgi:6-phosphogluconolactonase (cycloisomerase 2 family)
MNGNSRLQLVFTPGARRPGSADERLDERLQEIKRSMRTRFTWIAAVLVLLSIGFVMACSTKYSHSSNGLLVVPSRDSQAMQTFSIDLSNGHVQQINNVNGPPVTGLPSFVLLDPAGTYAYVATTVDCSPTNPAANTSLTAVQGAILAYKINSDGTLAAGNTPVFLPGNPAYPSTFPACGLDDASNPNGGNQVAGMTMDSAGKFLFVAMAPGTAIYTTNTNLVPPTTTTVTLPSSGIAVYSIGANAGLTAVTGSPFAVPATAGQAATPSALALTSTVFPALYAPCSGQTAPSAANLYVTDSVNNMLFNYMVSSSGILTLVPTGTNPIATGTVPSGVAVDPCDRFVYVANMTGNSVSAYTICTAINLTAQPPCLNADFSLNPVQGSPFSAADHPGPIAVDPYANFVYVVDTGSSQITGFRISAGNGSLASFATVATNSGPNSIAIRSDDSWLFVANTGSANISEFGITPASGALTLQTATTTLNYPSGVAVK